VGLAERADRTATKSWRRVLSRTWKSFNDDQIPAVAAGATFFALLALFPALGAFVSLYGLFAHVEDARRQIVALSGVLPGGAVSVLGDQMTRLASADHGQLGLGFAVGLVFSLWSANAGVKALMAGLNVACEMKERRGFIILNAVSLAFTMGGIAFALLAIAAVAAVPGLLMTLGLGQWAGASLLRWPVLLLAVTGLFSALYRYGPCRPRHEGRWLTPGLLVAVLGWMAMSIIFSAYVSMFGTYDRTYGPLGAMIGFMTWIWLSVIVVLAGAELNAAIARAETGPPR
jgi:membrane protein